MAFEIWAQQLIFSAELNVTNATLIHQNISVSSSHIQLKSANFDYLCEIENLQNEQNLENFLNAYKGEILDCFMLHRTRVQAKTIKNDQNVTKTLNLRILPTRFIIKFKPKSAIIEIISSKVK